MVDSERLNDLTLSRRDALRGGAALGTLALASRIGAYAQVVEAQITEPRIQLGSDYAIHDNGGNLVINHDPNGDIFEYDATADQITTLKPLTSVTTDQLNINDVITRVQKSSSGADQTINTGTVTKLTWNNTSIDELNGADLTDNDITVPTDGFYLIMGLVGYRLISSTGRFQVRIHINGSFQNIASQQIGSAGDVDIQVFDILRLSANDVVDLRAFQDSGSDAQADGANQTSLSVARVG